MKPKLLLLMLFTAALAAVIGWLAARHSPWPAPASNEASGRRVLFYQSAMHPWIKSDKPGKCTICGMDLTPVFEGEAGVAVQPGLVTLSSNSITALGVRSAPVRRGVLTRTLRVAGTIDDNDTRHRILSAYVDGRVDELFVNFLGAEVRAGEPLASFYSPMLLAAEREYASLKRRATGEPAGVDHAQLIGAALQRLRQFGLNDAQIAAAETKPQTNIHTLLVAPDTGTVVARHVYEGQYVKEGERLFEIADFSTMWFVFDVYERDLAWMQPGQALAVTTPAVPGRVFPAVISFIDPNLNPVTRSARVRADLPNPLIEKDGQRRRELLHKVFAEAVVTVEVPDLVLVPRGAVLSPAGKPVVYLDRGGAYEQRAVRLGRFSDAEWEVLDGLTEGDRVVLNGNLLIDAQAQLNRSVSPGPHDHGAASSAPAASPAAPAAPDYPPLTEAQRGAVNKFFTIVDSLGLALAADDLTKFNAAAPQLHSALPALAGALRDAGGWSTLATEIDRVGHLGSASDLKEARKSFSGLSTATVELAKRVRATDASFAAVKLFMCPMTEDAYPGAPKRGSWLQLTAPLRNPYFGAEMLDCGTEVR
jgi:membrane fusion protein, copper/silver efflux system